MTTLDHVISTSSLKSSGMTTIKNSDLNAINASGNTYLINSTAKDILASGHFQATNCLKLGDVKTSGSANFINCKEIKNISASATLSLFRTGVTGDVSHSGNNLEINDSIISGRLECNDQKISINDSFVNQIVVNSSNGSFKSAYSFFGVQFVFEKIIKPTPQQIVELNGENCLVGSIHFEEGVSGKVILKNGAKIREETNGEIFME